MQKVFLVSIIVTALFCFLKFAEMKYIDKELKPLKFIVRDAFIVLICSVIGCSIIFNYDSSISEFFNIVTDTTTITPANTQIFTDEPGF
jgi:hypothetical protein